MEKFKGFSVGVTIDFLRGGQISTKAKKFSSGRWLPWDGGAQNLNEHVLRGSTAKILCKR
ncbi:hypothetical protein PS874_06416 [Pseudomonas fluorescens]|uniref:hypothetical protein n=1 Tax=Pseudomonas fluorescens TaxID=294 RepID=UPI00123EF570|nr:hypothetical protein [Pseudomonas fluorescens]VVM49043.1 hypothetical protein PS639_00690 [Pseudomonas fluorescens]VVP62001.1 hypothetical protein PS874_06416 [Pseudomonas fluorescens]